MRKGIGKLFLDTGVAGCAELAPASAVIRENGAVSAGIPPLESAYHGDTFSDTPDGSAYSGVPAIAGEIIGVVGFARELVTPYTFSDTPDVRNGVGSSLPPRCHADSTSPAPAAILSRVHP